MNESLCLLDHRPIRKKTTHLIVLRGKGLGISPAETKRLPLGQFKARARQNFRKLVKSIHPDMKRKQASTHSDYRRLIDAYHYIMELESKAIEQPIHYFPLPWDWKQAFPLPEGWQAIEN